MIEPPPLLEHCLHAECTAVGRSQEASPFPCTCRLVDEIAWVKMTVNRRLAKSHGYYLQHAKEVCLVGKKGRDPPGMKVDGSGYVISPL